MDTSSSMLQPPAATQHALLLLPNAGAVPPSAISRTRDIRQRHWLPSMVMPNALLRWQRWVLLLHCP